MRVTVEADTWMIALNNDASLIYYDFINAGNAFATGQPIVEEYNNEAEWLLRLKELGITPE
tara:strand:- start:51 stop:233 length:183 start_codon:yes stop_codon:yes gene_type:complete